MCTAPYRLQGLSFSPKTPRQAGRAVRGLVRPLTKSLRSNPSALAAVPPSELCVLSLGHQAAGSRGAPDPAGGGGSTDRYE